MFENPLGLLALLAVPAIIALHLFRRRFPPRTVSALFLWSPEDRTPASGRTREPLRNSVSLWAELAAALALSLAIAGPRGCSGGESAHLVVVLDASASIGARTSSGETVRDRAEALVRARIEALPRGSRVSLLASGSPPRVLAGPSAFDAEALEALARFRPLARGHDLAPAVLLALELSGGGSVLVVTDHFEPDELAPEVELVALGEPLDNLAIAHAARARSQDGQGERLFVTVESHARHQRAVRVVLREVGGARAELAAPRALHLEQGGRQELVYSLAPATGAVEVALEGGDALGIDDVAMLAPSPRRTLAVACALIPAQMRELGLASAGEGVPDRWIALTGDAALVSDVSRADLAIAAEPAGGPSTWTLAVRAGAADRVDLVGPFLTEKRHPLLEGTTLEGVVWSVDPALRLTGAPLVTAGPHVLLTEDQREGRRVFELALDPARSSLQRSPDWPILLANLAEARRRELPGPERTNLACGEELVWRDRDASEPGARLEISGPDGVRELVLRPSVVVGDLGTPGLHSILRTGEPPVAVAVRFVDAVESDLGGCSSGTRASSAASDRREGATRAQDAVLAAIALGTVLLDWLVLARARDARPRALA